MLVCLDVDYRDAGAAVGCTIAPDWTSPDPEHELTHWVPGPPREYRSGQFYLRELPCLRSALAELERRGIAVSTIVVDGHVWLGDGKPGLGAHLHRALGGTTPVVGVAKSPFAGATDALEVRRGMSARPLWVSAVGVSPQLAAGHVAAMAGEHRIPRLIKRADRLARDARAPGAP